MGKTSRPHPLAPGRWGLLDTHHHQARHPTRTLTCGRARMTDVQTVPRAVEHRLVEPGEKERCVRL